MKLISKALITGFVLTASVAYAAATDPAVIARQDLMKTVGAQSKVLFGMAGDKAAFDPAAAEAAKAALVAASAEIAAKFEPQATDPESEAKAEIWTNWNDFVAKATALNAASTGLDVSSLDALKASIGPVGGTCKDCHTAYRM